MKNQVFAASIGWFSGFVFSGLVFFIFAPLEEAWSAFPAVIIGTALSFALLFGLWRYETWGKTASGLAGALGIATFVVLLVMISPYAVALSGNKAFWGALIAGAIFFLGVALREIYRSYTPSP